MIEVHIRAVRRAVAKHYARAGAVKSGGCGDVSIRGYDHLIAGPEVQQEGSQFQRVGTGGREYCFRALELFEEKTAYLFGVLAFEYAALVEIRRQECVKIALIVEWNIEGYVHEERKMTFQDDNVNFSGNIAQKLRTNRNFCALEYIEFYI
jgi:hypothetical protein